MQVNNLPQKLPMLPGNVYTDPTITRYHKTQLLGVKDGAIQGKHKFLIWLCALLVKWLTRYIERFL